jgi:hypothetical protein
LRSSEGIRRRRFRALDSGGVHIVGFVIVKTVVERRVVDQPRCRSHGIGATGGLLSAPATAATATTALATIRVRGVAVGLVIGRYIRRCRCGKGDCSRQITGWLARSRRRSCRLLRCALRLGWLCGLSCRLPLRLGPRLRLWLRVRSSRRASLRLLGIVRLAAATAALGLSLFRSALLPLLITLLLTAAP